MKKIESDNANLKTIWWKAFTLAKYKGKVQPVAYPGIFFWGGGVSTNSVEDRGQTERGLGAVAP
jgi:hypothetical protein